MEDITEYEDSEEITQIYTGIGKLSKLLREINKMALI